MSDSKNNSAQALGRLYVVATPIGNLNDMSRRAIEVLKQVDLIAAEDTRHTAKLLSHFGIKARQIAYHAHNEAKNGAVIVRELLEGMTVALVSDAGTPLISDPGERLVAEAIESGVTVLTIPGPCAAIAALSVSGLPTHQFGFIGFVPSSKSQRSSWIRRLNEVESTAIFYESPHRIDATIEAIIELLPSQRKICIARELTKQFESSWTGSIEQLKCRYESKQFTLKGEFVIILEGQVDFQTRLGMSKVEIENALTEEEIQWLTLLADKLPKKEVAAIVAKQLGRSKKHYYQWLVDNR